MLGRAARPIPPPMASRTGPARTPTSRGPRRARMRRRHRAASLTLNVRRRRSTCRAIAPARRCRLITPAARLHVHPLTPCGSSPVRCTADKRATSSMTRWGAAEALERLHGITCRFKTPVTRLDASGVAIAALGDGSAAQPAQRPDAPRPGPCHVGGRSPAARSAFRLMILENITRADSCSRIAAPSTISCCPDVDESYGGSHRHGNAPHDLGDPCERPRICVDGIVEIRHVDPVVIRPWVNSPCVAIYSCS